MTVYQDQNERFSVLCVDGFNVSEKTKLAFQNDSYRPTIALSNHIGPKKQQANKRTIHVQRRIFECIYIRICVAI